MNFPLKLILVRHSITAGNLAGQYIGRTDQPLCPEGINLAKAAALYMPQVERVYCSPMLRCHQTAALLFPNHQACAVTDLREIDFGTYEGKTYAQLAADPQYQEWIDSAGTLPPPGGESTKDFSKRCVAAFCNILKEMARDKDFCTALVVHGGSIMAIMSALANPKRPFYDWQVENCCGYIVEGNPVAGNLMLSRELHLK